MASGDNGRTLPKFGEWDAKDPASAEGFTMIFNKARDNKKNGGGTTSKTVISQKTQNQKHEASKKNHKYEFPRKKAWSCFAF
ncbi:RPM1-interacting protein 4-like [Momordica charantia]|uniref:RPM1-interacting protein 4-like n=1 Tax=Momordica charantia TaxID=3673 RepID=A0A6J1DEH9_MOMCH|nr:RPM1-interacting protein 4-like [Momordica charantia]